VNGSERIKARFATEFSVEVMQKLLITTASGWLQPLVRSFGRAQHPGVALGSVGVECDEQAKRAGEKCSTAFSSSPQRDLDASSVNLHGDE
jgi:hypothetical protein